MISKALRSFSLVSRFRLFQKKKNLKKMKFVILLALIAAVYSAPTSITDNNVRLSNIKNILYP